MQCKYFDKYLDRASFYFIFLHSYTKPLKLSITTMAMDLRPIVSGLEGLPHSDHTDWTDSLLTLRHLQTMCNLN